MNDLLLILIKGNIIVVLVYCASYLIEKITSLALFTKIYRRKQNIYVAHGAATMGAIFYISINLIVLVYNLVQGTISYDNFPFFDWIVAIILLAILFKIIHFMITPKDPEKDDYDFSD